MLSDVLFGWGLSLAGFLPFAHVNVVLAALGSKATPALVSALVFSHAVFSALPGVLFGVPSADHGVSVLASHSLVRQGHGRTALWAVLLGLLAGLLGAVLLYPAFRVLAPAVYPVLRPLTGWLLAALVVVALALDGFRPLHALGFLLCAALGAVSMQLPLSDGLFPLLSGLFGIPALLLSDGGFSRTGGPSPSIPWTAVFLASVLGPLSVFLPAVSPAYLGAVAFLFMESVPVSFLAVFSALSASKVFYDFAAVSAIGKARSAAAAVWLADGVSAWDAARFLAVGVLAFCVSWVVVALFWRRLCGLMGLFSHAAFRFFLVAAILFGALWTGGLWSVFLLVWSVCASLCLLSFRVPRKYALGALLGPAILFAGGWTGFF